METVQLLAVVLGAAWASGINLYATVLVLGFLGRSGLVTLPGELTLLTEPAVLFIAGLMYCIEFFADKTPGVDSAWDALHTFIRIPAGAILAWSALAPVDPVLQLAALLAGGSLAAGTHAAKSGVRLLLNSSPEPFSNWAASLGEDALAISGLWLAVIHPLAFLVALLLFLLFLAWFLPRTWGAVRAMFRRLQEMASSPGPAAGPG